MSGECRQTESGISSQILRDLGVRPTTPLSNALASVYVGLEGDGLEIVSTGRIE